MRKIVLALAALAVAIAVVPVAGAKVDGGDPSPSAADNAQTTQIQILGLNDFHGNLEPPTGSGGRIGACRRRVHRSGVSSRRGRRVPRHARAAARSTNPDTLFVSAGDLIGATPLISALFHDEPTIEVQPDAARLQSASATTSSTRASTSCCGCSTAAATRSTAATPCDGFDGAPFSARLPSRPTCVQGHGDPIFPPYKISPLQRRQDRLRRHDARRHAATSSRLRASPLDFFDEADSVNALVPRPEEAERRDDHRAPARGRQHRTPRSRRGFQDVNECNNFDRRRLSPSSTGSTTKSTSSSPAIRTGRSSASSTARSSRAPPFGRLSRTST